MARAMMGLAVTALLIAAHPPKDDKDELQGCWGIPSLEFAGMRLDGPDDQSLVFAGDKTWLQEVDKAGYRSTFKIDLSATPRTLDMEYIEGPDKGNTVLGIYRLEGDKLTLCLALPGNPRPTEFATKSRDHRFIMHCVKLPRRPECLDST